MRLPFGFEVRLTRAIGPPSVPLTRDVWRPIVREPYTGAWQRNDEATYPTVVQNPTVFSCVTLIAEHIAKCRLRLMQQQAQAGVWLETSNPAWSPVLRKPNRYQTIQKFVEAWIVSKLLHGNTYVLKQRDQRNVVVALYILDPTKVTPLVAPDGAVYYQLGRDDLRGLTRDVFDPSFPAWPASEVIHDLMVPLFHPLIGVTPIFAAAAAAIQGMRIQDNSTAFFANGSQPSGVLMVPTKVEQPDADKILDNWNKRHGGVNLGKTALLDNGMKYEITAHNAVDSQLIEQLNWTDETIASCFKVPISLIDSSNQAPYAKGELATQQFFSQCLQPHMTAFELSMDDGLALPTDYGTEFEIEDLIWMDTDTRTKAAADAVGAAVLTPNEARRRYYGMPPIDGGDSAYLQQQYYSLAALKKRDAGDPFAKPEPAPPAPAADDDDDDDISDDDLTAALADLRTKAVANGWIHAA